MSAPNALGSVAEIDVNYTEETATTTTDVSTLGSNINILFTSFVLVKVNAV